MRHARSKAIAAVVLSVMLAASPLSAFAAIEGGYGQPVDISAPSVEPIERIVTAGGWHDVTDVESATPALRLANVDSGAVVDLPAAADLMLFSDEWLVWTEPSGEDYVVRYRPMEGGDVRTLEGIMPTDATLAGDRLVGVTTDDETGDTLLIAWDLTSGSPVSAPIAVGPWSNGLALFEGEIALWAEAVDGDDETYPTLWNVKAWNMDVGGDPIDVALDADVVSDAGGPGLFMIAGMSAWVDGQGIRVVASDDDEEIRLPGVRPEDLAGSDPWLVWTAPGVSGQPDVFAWDVDSGDDPFPVTRTTGAESAPMISDGWVAFESTDPVTGVVSVKAVDLDSRLTLGVSDGTAARLVGIDGSRVTYAQVTGETEDGSDLSVLRSRLLGLPAPSLMPRYYGSATQCTVDWPAVAGAEGYEYTVGDGEIGYTESMSFVATDVPPGESVDVRVRSVIGEDVRSEWARATVRIAPPSMITLRSSSALVSERDRIALTGVLSSDGIRFDGDVRLQVSIDGVAWTDVPQAAVTATDGAFSFLTTPARTARYRVVFDGDDDHARATSPVVVVGMRSTVAIPAFVATARRSRAYTASGRVGPAGVAHPADAVTIYAYHKEGSRWVLRLRTAARTTFSVTTGSRFSASVKLTRTGKWRMQAVYKGTAVATKTSSGWRYTTVK